MPHATATASRIKRWALLVGSALALGFVFGKLGAALI